MRCRMHVVYYSSLEHKSSSIPEALSVFVQYLWITTCTNIYHWNRQRKIQRKTFIRTWLRILAASSGNCFVSFLVSHVPVLHVKNIQNSEPQALSVCQHSNFHSRAVHLDIVKVFIYQLMHNTVTLK